MKKERQQIKRCQRVVKATLKRDGDICQCCGCADGSEVHHIEPLFLGGADEVNNAICLCRSCHKIAPDNPNKFLEFQRSGGGFWTRASNSVSLKARSELQRTPHELKLRIIDSFRLNNWGWLSGVNASLNLWHDDNIKTAGVAAVIGKEDITTVIAALSATNHLNPQQQMKTKVLARKTAELQEIFCLMLSKDQEFWSSHKQQRSIAERILRLAADLYVGFEELSFSATYKAPLIYAANISETIIEIEQDLIDIPAPKLKDETGQFQLALTAA